MFFPQHKYNKFFRGLEIGKTKTKQTKVAASRLEKNGEARLVPGEF